MTWRSIQLLKKLLIFFFFFNFLSYWRLINAVNDRLIAPRSLNLTLEWIKLWNKLTNFFLGFWVFWVIRAVLTPLFTLPARYFKVTKIDFRKNKTFQKFIEFFFDFLKFLIYWRLINAVTYLLIAWRSLNLTFESIKLWKKFMNSFCFF